MLGAMFSDKVMRQLMTRGQEPVKIHFKLFLQKLSIEMQVIVIPKIKE